MTDNEIIKALECCSGKGDCRSCPFKNRDDCTKDLKAEIIGLITRQKAEIERLNKAVDLFADIGKMYSEIKAEAYKEFAERLKEKFARQVSKGYCKVLNDFVDNLLKEMVGEDK
jgi:hypothetical protein